MLPGVNYPFQYAANLIGAGPDELKLTFSFLLSYPLAGLLKRIPDRYPWQKNLFCIGVSLFYLIGLFDMWDGIGTILINALGVYAIAAFLQGPLMPWIAFLFVMGYMSVSHLHRQWLNNPAVVDITGAQMVLVMKLSAFAWNVYDGTFPESELSEFQKDHRLTELPSLLDFLGWVFFFPAFMVGPAFDFIDYKRYITTTMFALPPGTDPSKAPPTRPKRKIPRSGTPAMIKLATGLGWLLAFLQLNKYYYPTAETGPDFMKHNFFHRVWIMHMIGFTVRAKYYAVWTMTEGACILSGIGYNGIDPKTGRADWSRCQNIKPLGVELAQNAHAYLGNWNMNTNHWLRNYIYLRVTPKGKKPGFRASLATFMTSAFWHGFYPGYYLTFALAAFLQTIAKNCRRLVRPFFMTTDGTKPTPNKRYYDFLSYLITQTAFSFTVTPFVILHLDACILVWARVYFYAIIGAALCFGFLFSPGKAYLVQQLKKRQGRPAVQRQYSEQSEAARHGGIGMGVPDDPELTLQDMVSEVRMEIERRQRGEGGGLPTMEEIRRAFEDGVRVQNVESVKEAVRERVGRMPSAEDVRKAVEGKVPLKKEK